MTYEPTRWTADDAWESEGGQFIHEDDHDKAVAEAYSKGRADGKDTVHDCAQHSAACCSASYTAGYNDHARTVQHWQDTHGAYRQHGEGENP